jgi:hypothetical protein
MVSEDSKTLMSDSSDLDIGSWGGGVPQAP